MALCSTHQILNNELSIALIQTLGQEPSSPLPFTQQVPSHRIAGIFSSLILQTDALHLVGDVTSASIHEQCNIPTTVVCLQFTTLVTSRENIKTTLKGKSQVFLNTVR